MSVTDVSSPCRSPSSPWQRRPHVLRNALTQRHLDLKREFYAKVKERGQPTDAEARVRKQIVKLKELRDADKAELAELRADREALIRAVNQLTIENRQLRKQLTDPDPVVHVLPTQPRPPGRG